MKTKLSLLLFTLLFSTIVVIAPSLIMEKYSGGDVFEGKQSINQTWASITADPAVALSPPGVSNFTQKITVCNNANDSGFLFLDYNFNNDLVDHSFKYVNDRFVTTNENEPINTCEEVGKEPDNQTVCSQKDNFVDVTRFYSSLEDITPQPIKIWDGGVHYVVTKGSLFGGEECRSYILNYKPVYGVGKWNMRVWANTKDDYSCVEDETCPYDYILDPTFSTNYTYKQNIQLNFSTVNRATNNVTASIELTTINYNFSRNLLNGDDFVFTNFDETTALGCYRESFVNGTLGNFSVLITNFSNTTNTSIWMYHGNPSATSNQFCAEINNAYLLADLMNTSSVNSTIWNQAVGTAWTGSSNGYYQASTSGPQGCIYSKSDAVCGLTANTAGKLKQSQAYEVLYTAKSTGGAGNSCGHGVSWGTSSVYSSIGTNYESNVRSFMIQNDVTLGSVPSFVFTNNLVAVRARKINGINPTATILELWNSSNSSLDLGLSPVMVRNNVTAGENVTGVFTLANVDGSVAGSCPNTLFYDIRVKSYINTSIGLNMTGADGAVGSDGSINITNWTYVLNDTETNDSHYTVNVSWNANIVNAVYANFTIGYSTPGTFVLVGNTSGSNGGNMNWTQFNFSKPMNFTDTLSSNQTPVAHQWNFTIDINGTDLINNTGMIVQRRLWGYWINNVTWTSSVNEGVSNTFHLNLSKMINNATGFVYNITLEYGGVNQTPNATLVFNASGYEDYDFTMTAPDVVVNTVYTWTAWINFSFQNRLTQRSNRSNIVVMTGTQTVVATIPFAINNETFETTGLFDSGGISNYSINVTWDPNAYNNLSAVNFSINGFTYHDNQIGNVTIGNQTKFNISVYTPMVQTNGTTVGFNWTWLADGNVTDMLGNNSNRSQNVMWGWYVNNLSYVSPIASMSPNNIMVNFTKHVATPPGLYVNVTNEWNLTSSVTTSPFAYRKNIQINSTKAYQAVNNYTVNVLLNLSNHNFNRTQPDGDDVAFYNFDQTTLLGCYKESFDNTTMGNYSVLITNLSNATNTSVWVYYGNTTMPNQCPEINNAYLLADLMNSSSINSSIWNEQQGSDFSTDTTNGSYKSITTAGERCNTNTNEQNTPNCVMIANTSGVLKQSQTYQIDTRIKFDDVLDCGWSILFGSSTSNGAGTTNMSFEVNQDLGNEYQAFNENAAFLVPFLTSAPSTSFIKYRNIKINNNNARTLYSIFNSSTLSQEINLGTALNNSNPSNSFLNTSNKLTLMTDDASLISGCVTTLWDEIRVRSYINSTLNYTFGTETAIMPGSSALGTNRTATQLLTNTSTYEEWNLTFSTPVVYQVTNVSTKGWLNISFNGTYVIRDPTFIQVVNPFSNFSYETPLYETSLANFTFNVSNSSQINIVNFTWNTTIFNSSNITNVSSGTTTLFNISIRLPLIPSNQSNYSFQWNMTLANGTTFNTNLTNQTLLLAYYPNRIHRNTSEIEGSTQNQIINITKHIFAAGLQEYVNLEYNQTNYSSSLYVNGTNYQDYNAVFSTPLVNIDTTVQELGWLNVSFGSSSIDGTMTYLRNTSNTTQFITNINVTGGTCSNIAGFNAVINFTFFDEFSNKSIKQNGSDQITIWSNSQQNNQTFGFNFINTNFTEICIACTNCNLTSNFNIQFSDNETTYGLREYWERLYNFNTTFNLTKNITLYNLLNQNATEVIFNVGDANNDPIQNMIVEVLKYNISNNSFKIVDTEITDFDGKARTRLFQADDYYKVRLRDGNNTIVLETTLFKLLFTEYFISVVPTTTDIRTVIHLTTIPHNLTFDNGTKLMSMSWNDIENVTNNNCLEVVNITNASGQIINKQCSSNRSGYFTFNLTNINGTYIGKYTVGDNSFLIDAIEIILQPFINLGREGLWLAFIMIGTLSAIGLSIDPTVSIIFTLLGVIVMSFTGMLPIGWLTLTGIVAAGIITALVINKVQ